MYHVVGKFFYDEFFVTQIRLIGSLGKIIHNASQHVGQTYRLSVKCTRPIFYFFNFLKKVHPANFIIKNLLNFFLEFHKKVTQPSNVNRKIEFAWPYILYKIIL